jgi:rhodanese-related sulfurtransferase
MATAVRIKFVDIELCHFWLKSRLAWLVDVREESEYHLGMIEKAFLQPYSTFEPSLLPYVDPILGKPKRLVFFCLHGNIAPLAGAAWGQEIGSSVAFVMEGGFSLWLEEGFPVVSLPQAIQAMEELPPSGPENKDFL